LPKFDGPPPTLPDLKEDEEQAEPEPTSTPKPEEPEPSPTPEPKKPEPTPTVPPPMPTPTPPAPVPMAEEKASEPTVPPAVPMAEEKPAKPASPSAGRPQAPATRERLKGDFTDYFPCSVGSEWTYAYLGGSQAKRNVACVARQEFSNGTVRIELKVTEAGRTVEEKYSLYQSKMEHTSTDGKPTGGALAFKMPPRGGETSWVERLPDGTVKTCKASMGKAAVFQRTYPDCVIVVKKFKKGGEERTAYTYFAKGIGLLSEEMYDASMKLLHAGSFALVGGPEK
jgi:hypothetical protein